MSAPEVLPLSGSVDLVFVSGMPGPVFPEHVCPVLSWGPAPFFLTRTLGYHVLPPSGSLPSADPPASRELSHCFADVFSGCTSQRGVGDIQVLDFPAVK